MFKQFFRNLMPDFAPSSAFGAVMLLSLLNAHAQNTGDFRSRWNTTAGSATVAPASTAVAFWETYNATTGLWSATTSVPLSTTKNIYIREGVQQNFNASSTFGTNMTVGEGNAATASATMVGGVVTEIAVTNSGSLIVLPAIQILGPATTLATATISDVSVNGYDVSKPGSNYSNPVVTIGNIWAAGTSCALNTQVNSGGNLYTCTTAGISGTTAPSGTGTSITDGTAVWKYAGVAATGIAKVGNVTRGSTTYTNGITEVQITNGGYGYISMPVTVITDPTGTNAVAEARVGINAITVISGGSGYTTAPLINLGSCLIAGSQSSTTGRTVTISGNLEFKAGAICVSGGPAQPGNMSNSINVGGNLITAADMKFFSKNVTSNTNSPNYTATTAINFPNGGSIITNAGSVAFYGLSVAAAKTLTLGNASTPANIRLTQASPINYNTTGIVDATYGNIEFLKDPIATTAVAQTIASGAFLNNTLSGITINNTDGVTTNSDLTITGSVSLQSGVLNVAAGKVVKTTSPSAFLSGGNSLSYINTTADASTGAAGILQVENIAATTTLPVGNAGNYLPVTIQPTEVSSFSVNVFKGATDNGLANGTATSDKSKIADAVYSVSRTVGTGAVTLSLGFPAALKGVSMVSSFGIARLNGTVWDTPVGSGNGTTLTATGSFTDFGAFRIESNSSEAVSVTSFTAKSNTYDNQVQWQLSSEAGIDKFIIERSADNVTYAQLKAVPVTGTLSYDIKDTNPIAGTNYYRLIQYNTSGTTQTFGPVTASFKTPDPLVTAPKQMEYLTRGVVASRINSTQVLVSWRMLGTDSSSVSFNVYRNGVKVNASPISTSTNYLDNTTINGTYIIKDVINGTEVKESKPVTAWANNWLKIPLQQPAGGTTPDGVAYTYRANDASVGDVDGDGEYEIFLKWQPTNETPNTGDRYTGNTYIDCMKLDGSLLWRIDLGINIMSGPHYTQFMVYDFDGDGKAEMACKTADGSKDATGLVIGDATADYRNSTGTVLSGPEYLSMFDGLTGKVMSTVDYIPARGTVSSWGDSYGNRVDRFLGVVAYLDGVHPSLVMGRGYYTRLVRTAWDYVDKKLKLRWIFDSNDSGNGDYYGQGNHQMSVADVDGDGKQELSNGSSIINDDGKGLWTDRKGHGDALHLTDMDPSTPDLEEWMNLESPNAYAPYGLRMRNARTGETLWGIATGSDDVGRSMAADIDPNYPGYEVWGSSGGSVYSAKGEVISTSVPSYNFGIWWDGDLSRELLDKNIMDKWNATTKKATRLYTIYNSVPVTSNNDTKATPCLSADILGDWREELLMRTSDNQSLYLITTQYATDYRFYTLMHDPQYRVAIAWQNNDYNQPPYPSFFLGTGMAPQPKANIYTVGGTVLPISLTDFTAKAEGDKVVLKWTTASESGNKLFTVERSLDGIKFEDVLNVNGSGYTNFIKTYSAVDYSPLAGTTYYRLKQTDFNGNSTTSGVVAVTFLQKNAGLSVSPNPFINAVKLDLPNAGLKLSVTLYSIDGKVQFQGSGSLQELNSKLNSILSGLPAGFYSLVVKDNGQVYNQKLIKQ